MGIFLCFDLTRYDTWTRIHQHWLPEIEQFCGKHVPIVLVGCKNDEPVDVRFTENGHSGLKEIYDFVDK
jgi:GTPase SAR1 family protein